MVFQNAGDARCLFHMWHFSFMVIHLPCVAFLLSVDTLAMSGTPWYWWISAKCVTSVSWWSICRTCDFRFLFKHLPYVAPQAPGNIHLAHVALWFSGGTPVVHDTLGTPQAHLLHTALPGLGDAPVSWWHTCRFVLASLYVALKPPGDRSVIRCMSNLWRHTCHTRHLRFWWHTCHMKQLRSPASRRTCYTVSLQVTPAVSWVCLRNVRQYDTAK